MTRRLMFLAATISLATAVVRLDPWDVLFGVLFLIPALAWRTAR